jgi:hypothetical protein
MKEVLSSAAKAELGALFHNSKEACLLQIALTEMGHPQTPPPFPPTTPLQLESPTSPSNNANPKPLTCTTIAYANTFPKANSLWYGRKEKAI